MYKVLVEFADLQDKNYVYHVGDEYPRNGVKLDSKRVSELSGSSNKIGKPLIEEVKKPVEEKEDKPAKKKTAKVEE